MKEKDLGLKIEGDAEMPSEAQNGDTTTTEHAAPKNVAIPDDKATIETVRDRIHEIEQKAHHLTVIGKGGDNIVYDLGEMVAKTTATPNEYSLAWLQINRENHSLIQQYLGKYLPATEYYEAYQSTNIPELDGRPVIIQEKIRGKILDEVSEEDLNDPVFLDKLIDCMERVLQFNTEHPEETTDWRGGLSRTNKHSIFSPLCSSNVMITNLDFS